MTFGRKFIEKARGLGQNILYAMRLGTKFGRKAVGVAQTVVDSVKKIPIVGSFAKPVVGVAEGAINLGNRILKGADSVIDAGETAVDARSLGALRRAGGKLEEAYRNF